MLISSFSAMVHAGHGVIQINSILTALNIPMVSHGGMLDLYKAARNGANC